MRKIVANLFISLDGVAEAPDKWHFQWFNDEMMEIVQRGIESSDAMLLGRRTYQEFASYWPAAEGEMADQMNGIAKYVVSRTLTTADWQNTTLVDGDVEARLKELKESDGKDINIVGSPTLIRTLLAAGLVDELSLLIHPVALGSGARLFPEGSDKQMLDVVSTRALSTGVLHVVYRAA
jgi:dihydrofolate reductase